MISFDHGNARFQLRAAAVIEHGGAILLHRGVHDDFWALPGGRVEQGEPASATIVRELREELDELVECDRLLYVAENFFEYSGKRYHEVGLYFLARLSPDSTLPAHSGSFLGMETDPRLEFAWFPRSQLLDVDVRPSFLRKTLSQSRLGFEHVIQHD